MIQITCCPDAFTDTTGSHSRQRNRRRDQESALPPAAVALATARRSAQFRQAEALHPDIIPAPDPRFARRRVRSSGGAFKLPTFGRERCASATKSGVIQTADPPNVVLTQIYHSRPSQE